MKRLSIISSVALAALLAITACEKGFQVETEGNAARYQSAQNAIVSLRNDAGQAYFTNVEMRKDQETVNITGRLLGSASSVGPEASLSFGDASMVENYNATYGTAYEMFPLDNASLSAEELVFAMGEAQSDAVEVSLSAQGLRPDVTYMLPLVTGTDSKGVTAGEPMYLLVKDYRSIPDNNKGVKLFHCVESDDHHLLDLLAFRLKNSGKYLIDVQIIFTSGGDVKFDATTGEIRMPSNRGTIGHLSRQKEILDEARKRGVKTICTITTNGINQLETSTAKVFARKLADFVYAQGLDGLFFDTEYSGYDQRPGISGSSTDKMTRFLLELKRAMPDKMVVVYLYGALSGLRNVSESDGVPLKDFVDYGLNDYGASIVPSALGNAQVGILSDNFASGYRSIHCSDESKCRRAGEYGAHMFYCLNSKKYNDDATARRCLDNIARIWYNDEIVYDPLPNVNITW